ncbi:MAG: ankyrin repeat domain-containing protein [Bdellovibrionales bacterium]|nr:ankyrin repeat domain-containing protein [Bdellovibrionales bacterium]
MFTQRNSRPLLTFDFLIIIKLYLKILFVFSILCGSIHCDTKETNPPPVSSQSSPPRDSKIEPIPPLALESRSSLIKPAELNTISSPTPEPVTTSIPSPEVSVSNVEALIPARQVVADPPSQLHPASGNAFHSAVRSDDLTIMKNLALQFRTRDLWQQDSRGRYPIHYARSRKMVRWIWKNGDPPSTELKDKEGKTPLIFMIEQGFTSAALKLISICSMNYFWKNSKEITKCINSQDNQGMSAFHWATLKREIKIVNALVQNPWLDLDSRDYFGRTALHYAAIQKDFSIGYHMIHMSADRRREGFQNSSFFHNNFCKQNKIKQWFFEKDRNGISVATYAFYCKNQVAIDLLNLCNLSPPPPDSNQNFTNGDFLTPLNCS